LNTQLDELARSLSSMIDEVNSLTATTSRSTTMKPADNTTSLAASAKAQDKTLEEADPMVQIQAILNAHLDSLSWINGTVRELEGKVSDLERKFGTAAPADDKPIAAPIPRVPLRGLGSQHSTLLEGSMMGSSRHGGSSTYGLRR
jgi:hypothetical protein